MAGRPLHESHVFYMYRGLIFCVACGGYSSQRAQLLARPCTGDLPKSGEINLCRAWRGLLFGGLARWPDAQPLASRAASTLAL